MWTIQGSDARAVVSRRAYVPGLILIGMATLVLAAPQILVALVAAVLFTAGLAALSFAWKIRHMPSYTIEASPIEPLTGPWFELFRRI